MPSLVSTENASSGSVPGGAPASLLEGGSHRRGDSIFKAVALGAGLTVLAILALIAFSTTREAWPAFKDQGLSFVTSSTWIPAEGKFGALAFIYGTVLSSFLALLLAVLERRARVMTGNTEIYASAVGGVRLVEPGADLALCLALVSAIVSRPLAPDLVVFGEVGLAGEVRQVAHAKRRLTEAARLGFRRAIVPAHTPNGVDGITQVRVATLAEALSAAGLTGT